MKNKFSFYSGIMFFVISFALGSIFGTTLNAAFSLETGYVGLLVYIIPLLLIIFGFFRVMAVTILLILLQAVLYANNFIFSFMHF